MFNALRRIAAGLERIAMAMEEENRSSVAWRAAQNEVIKRATDVQRDALRETERYHQEEREHMAASERRYLARLAGEGEPESVKH